MIDGHLIQFTVHHGRWTAEVLGDAYLWHAVFLFFSKVECLQKSKQKLDEVTQTHLLLQSDYNKLEESLQSAMAKTEKLSAEKEELYRKIDLLMEDNKNTQHDDSISLNSSESSRLSLISILFFTGQNFVVRIDTLACFLGKGQKIESTHKVS